MVNRRHRSMPIANTTVPKSARISAISLSGSRRKTRKGFLIWAGRKTQVHLWRRKSTQVRMTERTLNRKRAILPNGKPRSHLYGPIVYVWLVRRPFKPESPVQRWIGSPSRFARQKLCVIIVKKASEGSGLRKIHILPQSKSGEFCRATLCAPSLQTEMCNTQRHLTGHSIKRRSNLGPWRNWERNSLARKRLWVQVPSVPPMRSSLVLRAPIKA